MPFTILSACFYIEQHLLRLLSQHESKIFFDQIALTN